jgi:hypothetical protein
MLMIVRAATKIFESANVVAIRRACYRTCFSTEDKRTVVLTLIYLVTVIVIGWQAKKTVNFVTPQLSL